MTSIDLTGYRLTFDDEFNTRSISQTGQGTTWADIRSQWRYDANSDIGFGHSSFVDPASGYDPFSVQGGALSITAVPDRTPYGYPGSWESGLITTQGNFSQTYGYFEMRADLADAKGGWDAFWLLPNAPAPNPNNLPGWQELDVVEHYGANNQGSYRWIHTTDPELNKNANYNLQVTTDNPTQVTGYHTYGMDWEKDKISFYFDGQLMGSRPTPSDMNGPMYLLANLATQTDADQAGVPMTMKIDYIRAFSKDPNAVSVVQDTVSAPDGADPGLYGASSKSLAPVSVSIGAGSDTLVLKMSQDFYKDNAQFTVSVDGQQVGGILAANAVHATGQSDTVTLKGDWATGDHQVSINFLNDAYGGSASTDRNLYLDSATYNGFAVSGSQIAFMTGGTQAVLVHDTTPVSVSIGAGSDTLVLKMSQDFYMDNAQFTVSVDGQQVGGILAAHATHSAGPSDTVTLKGDWAGGDHQVSINFLNDAYGGSASTDRNLYLDSATYNGFAVSGSQIAFMTGGAQAVLIHDATPVSVNIGAGPDALVLKMSQDFYTDNAQFTVSVDGQQVGGILAAHATHSAGPSDTVTLKGDWAAGDHQVSINFLNDAYGGSASTDRNLYLDSATYNGHAVSGSQFAFMIGGVHTFGVHDLG